MGAARAVLRADWVEAERLADHAHGLLVRTMPSWARHSRRTTAVAIATARDELGALADDLVAWAGEPLCEVFRSAAACSVLATGDRAGAARLVDRWWVPPVADWTWESRPPSGRCWRATSVPPTPCRSDAWLPSRGLLTLSGTSALAVGSSDGVLSRLAHRLGRRDDAVTHARAALAWETAAGLAAWAPRSARWLDELTGAG